MAKVEIIKKKNINTQWEPFVNITLSKREAVGLTSLLYVANDGLVRGMLYYNLEKALTDVVDTDNLNAYTDGLSIVGALETGRSIDSEFGEV